MNWTALIPLLLDLVRRLLDRKANPQVMQSSAAESSDLDSIADQLEAAAPKAGNVAGQPVGADDGIVAHLQRLATAVRSRDWTAIRTELLDLLGHL